MKSRECPNVTSHLLILEEWLLEVGAEDVNYDRMIQRLICLEGGGNCSRYTWFREWNEWTALAGGLSGGLRKATWTRMFTEAWRTLVGEMVDAV